MKTSQSETKLKELLKDGKPTPEVELITEKAKARLARERKEHPEYENVIKQRSKEIRNWKNKFQKHN